MQLTAIQRSVEDKFVLNDRSSLPRCSLMHSQQEPASTSPHKKKTSRLVVHVYRIPWDGRKGLLSPTFLFGRFADSALDNRETTDIHDAWSTLLGRRMSSRQGLARNGTGRPAGSPGNSGEVPWVNQAVADRFVAAKRHLLGRQNHCVRGRQHHHRIWTLIWGSGNHVAYRPYDGRTYDVCYARNKFF